MSGYQVLAGAGAALVAGGLCALAAGLYGRDGEVSVFRSRFARVRRAGGEVLARRRATRLAAALAAALVVWLVSGWPAAGLVVAAAVLVVPVLVEAPRVAARRIARLEALEEWVRRLADAMAVGSAPVQTLTESAEHAPRALRAELGRLATRLRTPRLDRTTALRQFADDVDDPLGDVVVLALQRAVSADDSSRVPLVLQGLASAVSAEVRGRRALETARTGPRKETVAIVVTIGLLVAGVMLFTNWAHAYATVSGQLVLLVLGGVALLALWLLRRLTLGRRPPRILPAGGGES